MAEGFFESNYGPVYSKDGKIWLTSPAGPVAVTSPEEARGKLATGIYKPASREEALNEETRIARSSLGQQALTLTESALAGAQDVLTAPVTLPIKAGAALAGTSDPTQAISGRATQGNLASLAGSAAEAAGLTQQTGEATGAQFEQASRERAQVNPGVAFAGSLLGQAAGGGLMGGAVGSLGTSAIEAAGGSTAAALGARAGLGALEGAAYGGAQASEDAFIQNRQLTSEQMLTHLGAGAFIGGLVGFGSEGLVQGVKEFRSRIAAPAAVSKELPGSIPASDAAIADAAKAGPLQGEEAAPNLASSWRKIAEAANEHLSTAQSAATGADREALQKFSPLNPANWEKTADHPYDLYHNRTQILEGATQDITTKVQTLSEKAQAVGREVWEAPAKRELVAENLKSLAPEQHAAALQASRDMSEELQAEIAATARAASGAKTAQPSSSLPEFSDTVLNSPSHALPPGMSQETWNALQSQQRKAIGSWGQEAKNGAREFVNSANAANEALTDIADTAAARNANAFNDALLDTQSPVMRRSYRGLHDLDELDHDWIAGEKTFTTDRISSATWDPHAAREFAHTTPGSGRKSVLLVIDHKTGANLGSLNRLGSEREVTLPKGLNFRVKSTQPLPGENGTIVHLVEEGAEAAETAVPGESTAISRYLSDLNEWHQIQQAASKGDLADTYSALDRLKRAMQKKIDTTGRTLSNETNPFLLDQKRLITEQLEASQQKLRNFLEDESVWGKQGVAQRETNEATSRWLSNHDFFNQSFMTRTGREYGGIGGRPIFEADRDKIGAYIQNLGTKQGSLKDKAFREYVAATEDFTSKIGQHYPAGSDTAQALNEVKQAAADIRSTMERADKTVKTANQIDEIANSEGNSGLGMLGRMGMGGVLGGPLGVLGGALMGAITQPGQMIRQAAAIKQIANRVDGQIGKSLAAFFTRATGKVQKFATRAAPVGRAAVATPKAAMIDGLTAFRGKHPSLESAYHARVSEVLQANANHGAAIRERARNGMGDLPNLTPKLSQAIILAATNAADYLQNKIPSGLVSPTVFQPTRPAPVDRAAIESFAKIWAAVNSPLTALKDLERGTLTLDQVAAMRSVYPELYGQIRSNALEMLRVLDLKGTPVPYRDKLQLDVLLDLNGAGEATMDPGFALRVDSLRQQALANHQGAQPPMREVPIRAADAARTTLQRLESQ